MLYEFNHHQIATLAPTDPTGAADEQLMMLVQRGDEAALATLYRRHTAILRTVIARVVHIDADVDDLLQEVFLEIWKRCQTYEEKKGKVLGWMITMARRRAIDRVRRRQAYARAEERLRLQCEAEDREVHYHVEEDAAASERATMLQQTMAALPDAQREALQLAFYQGLSQRQIAAKTGVPLGTIKTRLELALRKLRTALTSLGGVEEWSLNRA
ncbi:MAG TPA: sigma-70 family RNA polymerase sigma factor [Chthoniobacter sp.]|jgi:RNA polymerase sigma-70 factor (ECF subfamily)